MTKTVNPQFKLYWIDVFLIFLIADPESPYTDVGLNASLTSYQQKMSLSCLMAI